MRFLEYQVVSESGVIVYLGLVKCARVTLAFIVLIDVKGRAQKDGAVDADGLCCLSQR